MSQALQQAGAVPGWSLVTSDVEFAKAAERGLGRLVRGGLVTIAVLVLGIGGLLSLLPMAGAVIAPGEVSVETHIKEISHPFGGVAADILVRDGDHVKKGQVLLRLDNTVAGAAAEFTGLSLDQLLARSARLRAFQSGAGAVTFPTELIARASDPAVKAAMDDERRSFALSRQALADQVRQLQARVAQTNAEIASYGSQIASYGRQEALIRQELNQTRELYEERLTTLDRLNALERAAVGVEAQKSAAMAGRNEAYARVGELRTQMDSVTSSARSQASLELNQTQAAVSDLRKADVQASDQNDRSTIKAPQDGIVDKLAVRTIGSVVPVGEPLMEIVPDQDRLVVRTHVKLTDIDQVVVGQSAHVRFTALSMRTTPELAGKVTQVAADRTIERATGITYFVATISIPDEEYRKLGKARLSVGMPAEAFIQTEQRTILQYIVRPLMDQLKRALRE